MVQSEQNGGEFRTLNGYRELEKGKITSAMEDYLEMIYRIAGSGEPVRVTHLARLLHVTPSSVTKMITHLGEHGCVEVRPYEVITMTEYGRTVGEYLSRRHETIHRFLCALNGTEEELEQTEKIEHFIGDRTLKAMERALAEGWIPAADV